VHGPSKYPGKNRWGPRNKGAPPRARKVCFCAMNKRAFPAPVNYPCTTRGGPKRPILGGSRLISVCEAAPQQLATHISARRNRLSPHLYIARGCGRAPSRPVPRKHAPRNSLAPHSNFRKMAPLAAPSVCGPSPRTRKPPAHPFAAPGTTLSPRWATRKPTGETFDTHPRLFRLKTKPPGPDVGTHFNPRALAT